KPLLKVAVESSYYEAWKFMPILYLGVGFQALSNFFGSGYLSSKNTKGALTTTVYGAIITLVLSCLLVPVAGLFGASIATLVG
ncbi:polysaccharide biosynthesis C-terminal domain-containing protein, partial [Providencia rettgeri]